MRTERSTERPNGQCGCEYNGQATKCLNQGDCCGDGTDRMIL